MDGVLLVDKPSGMTSHDVVDRIRKIAGQRRVGHGGTLDPDATGLLVVLLGAATKLSQYVADGDKRYDAVMIAGVETDTLDAGGKIVAERSATGVTGDGVADVMAMFRGRVTQKTPLVSAVKVDGRPLYAYARSGQTAEPPARDIEIRELGLSRFVPGEHPEIHFTVTASKGTFVRALAADIGAKLGTGGSLKVLRRLASGPFTVSESTALANLEQGGLDLLKRRLLPPAAALRGYPTLSVRSESLRAVANGAGLTPAMILGISGGPSAGDVVAVLGPDQRLLAVHRYRGDAVLTEVVRVLPQETRS